MNGFVGLCDWERDNKTRPLSYCALCHNQPAVAISNFAADGEADPGALVFLPGMEPLEDDKNLLGELFVEPDPVIDDMNLADQFAGRGAGDEPILHRENAAG